LDGSHPHCVHNLVICAIIIIIITTYHIRQSKKYLLLPGLGMGGEGPKETEKSKEKVEARNGSKI
jgi:hypothetical protein